MTSLWTKKKPNHHQNVNLTVSNLLPDQSFIQNPSSAENIQIRFPAHRNINQTPV